MTGPPPADLQSNKYNIRDREGRHKLILMSASFLFSTIKVFHSVRCNTGEFQFNEHHHPCVFSGAQEEYVCPI